MNELTVNIAAMAYFDDYNNEDTILNIVDDTVVTDSYPPFWRASQLDCTLPTRIRLQLPEFVNNAFLELSIELLQDLLGFTLNLDGPGRHR